jgi:hypothetical protein
VDGACANVDGTDIRNDMITTTASIFLYNILHFEITAVLIKRPYSHHGCQYGHSKDKRNAGAINA